MKVLAFIIGLITLLSLELSFLKAVEAADEGLTHQKIEDFYVITLPKSGSHLLTKLIVMLTDWYPNGMHALYDHLDQVSETEFEETVLQCQENHQFAFNHTGDFGALFDTFSKHHPEYISLLMIRNLRDVLVSYAFYVGDSLEEQAIIHLAKSLNVDLTQEKLQQIQRELFGNSQGPAISGTFRSGQIGSWKNLFKPEHEELFLKHWNAFQIQLGYL
jgi:hypothetical protein